MICSLLRTVVLLSALAGFCRAQAPAAPEAAWSHVSITRGADDLLRVSVESDLLRLDYGPDLKPGKTTVSKALALVYKPTGDKIGPFDSRYSPSRTDFLTLRHAEQIPTRSLEEVAVRLYFLTRIVDVTLIRGTTFARFDYTFAGGSRHTYDQVSLPGAPNVGYFYSGHDAYSKHMGWSGDPRGEAPYAPYPFSFYRDSWGAGRLLEHHGWLVIGAGADGSLGYGTLLPLEKVQWLKLMVRTGGLERMMTTDRATVYYYLVPQFSRERALQLGQDFVDRLK